MKLKDYIAKHYDNNNAAFGRDNGLSRAAVGVMVNKGTYYVHDGLLMIARRELRRVECTDS